MAPAEPRQNLPACTLGNARAWQQEPPWGPCGPHATFGAKRDATFELDGMRAVQGMPPRESRANPACMARAMLNTCGELATGECGRAPSAVVAQSFAPCATVGVKSVP